MTIHARKLSDIIATNKNVAIKIEKMLKENKCSCFFADEILYASMWWNSKDETKHPILKRIRTLSGCYKQFNKER